jgi:hypothetical protein
VANGSFTTNTTLTALDHHKSRWVVQGFTRQPGIDFDKTFSPVVKTSTICVVLSLALSENWPIHQLDKKMLSSTAILWRKYTVNNPLGLLIPLAPLMSVASSSLYMG